ncbi:hypothetical protein L9F63_001370, partial [Diploptera punctata]
TGNNDAFSLIPPTTAHTIHMKETGEFHLGYPRTELQGASWYHLLHWDCMREAQSKHRLITKILRHFCGEPGDWLWVHGVLQVKDNMENSQQPVIVCTNQVLGEREASVMRANSWLYHYYMVQSKLQYGLAYEAHAASRMAAAAAAAYYHPHPHPPPPPPPPPHPQVIQHHHLHNPTDAESPGYPTPTPGQPPDSSGYRYGRRNEAEPVDYSIPHPSEEQGEESSPSVEVIVDLDRGGGAGGGGTILVSSSPMVTSIQHPVGRPRVLVKAAMVDPAEFMEQWNPSPPWSDTTVQKVPDIIHQDLSPYMTTTPPTPTGTPGSNSNSGGGSVSHQPSHSAFTFDWTPEQYVPNLQGIGVQRGNGSMPIPDEEQYHLMGTATTWPSEHRLFPLQPPPTSRLGLQPAMARLEPESSEQ